MSRPIPAPETRPVAESSKDTATFDAVGSSAETLADSSAVPVVRESQTGTCCQCRKVLPSSFPELPEPANLLKGRFDVHGAYVEVQDNRIGRRVVMRIQGVPAAVVVEPMRWWPGTKAIAAFSAMTMGMAVAVLAWPMDVNVFPWLGVFLALVGSGLFGWVRWLHPPCDSADDIAVDTAWRELVPRLQQPRALMAACRGSLGRGNPADRIKPLRILAEKAADAVPTGMEPVQLLAVARVLQALDAVRLGTDSGCAIAELFEPFFEGELPPLYIEAVTQTLIESKLLTEGEQRRLRILLLASAFDAGVRPADFAQLALLHHLHSLMQPLDVEVLNELYAVWRGLPPEAGAHSGRAATVFELAVRSPGIARKLLARWPDLILRISLPEHLRKSIGEVVLTPRGLFLDDLLIEDDDSTFGIERSPTGSGWYIAVGHQKLNVDRKPQGKITEVLAAWLEYRKTKLLSAVAKLNGVGSGKLRELLEHTESECPQCGARNHVVAGRVGIESGAAS